MSVFADMTDRQQPSKWVGPDSSRADIEGFIADATQRLKGPLSNLERAFLYADREEAREALLELDKAQP